MWFISAMTKIEAIAYLRKKVLLEKKAALKEQFNVARRETEETMRELEEIEKKNLTNQEDDIK